MKKSQRTATPLRILFNFLFRPDISLDTVGVCGIVDGVDPPSDCFSSILLSTFKLSAKSLFHHPNIENSPLQLQAQSELSSVALRCGCIEWKQYHRRLRHKHHHPR